MQIVSEIYSKGKKVQAFPFRLYTLECVQDAPSVAVVFSVPKKLFKRAVKRNLIRRRTKEAFRHIRAEYPALDGKHLLFVYISPEVLDYGSILEGLKAVLAKV